MNKLFLGFVLGVASVLIVGMFIQSASAGFWADWFNSPPKQGSGSGSGSLIRAHSCDADQSCETNILIAKDFVDAPNFGLYDENPTNAVASFGLEPSQNFVYLETYLGYDLGLGGNQLFLYTRDNVGAVLDSDGHFNVKNKLIVSTMSGNSTAYVCVDSIGKLFRSNTACR